MYITAINTVNQNQNYSNVDFRAKKIPTKAIKPEKVLDTMALMSGALAAAGIAITKKKTEDNGQMSNEEFKALKSEIEEKMKSYELDINYIRITKNNVLVISKIMDNPIFKKVDQSDKYGILLYASPCKNDEIQDAKIKFLDTVGKDDELLDHIGLNTFMSSRIKSKEDAENIIKMYNYVINNETLHNYLKNNTNKYENYRDRYSFSDLHYDMKENVQLLPRIMEDENLKDNFKILVRTDYAKDKNYEQLLNTLSNKKELLQNENVKEILLSETYSTILLDAASLSKVLSIEDEDVMNNILQVTNKHDTYDESTPSMNSYRSFMKALLNTKELYKNKDISENLEKILDIKPRSEVLRADRIAIIEKIDSSEKLSQNQELMNNIGKILASIKIHDKYKQVMETLDLIDKA